VPVLYLDYELAGGIISARVAEYEQTIGRMPAGMNIWSASVSEMAIDLTKPEGIEGFVSLLKEVNPSVVVIDTVRSAWPGMEEKSPHAWVRVNQFCKAIRQTGRAAVIVHHRNKPGQNGMGREAGSTAQLTDIDTQIIVTKVSEDKEQALREAALPDSETVVIDSVGVRRSAFSYLRMMAPPGHEIRAVFEISFGKLRQATENHVPTFVGIAENHRTGARRIVSSMTPRQKANALAARGEAAQSIADRLQIPEPTVSRWLEEKDEKAAALRRE
jgi:DNA-binding NarL/FixJ family response regulator